MNKPNTPQGFRGYIASRPVAGVPYPHKVQNLVVRDYCRRKDLMFLLSATEVAIPDSVMMLNDVLNQLDGIAGVVVFSIFMLPADKAQRKAILEKIVGDGKELHGALEEIVVRNAADIAAVEDLISLNAALPSTPFGGFYDKESAVAGRDAFEIKG